MNKVQLLNVVKNSIDEIIENTPYDLNDFENREEEKKYINNKTSKFDLKESLLSEEENDSIMVITDNCKYAVSPVFIHSDAFVKLLNYIRKDNRKFNNSDVIDFYTKKGYILIRLVNNNGVIGCDLYIPEKINDYQIRALDIICRELNDVYKELEDFDEDNAKNIKYSIKTIKDSVKEKKLVKRL